MKPTLSVLSLIAISIFTVSALAEGEYWGQFRGEWKPGEGLIVATKQAKPPAGLTKEYPAAKWNFYSIDLDQDGKPDFITESKKEFKTCFVKSDLSIKNCEKLNHSLADGFGFELFVSQGKNKMLLMLDLSGDEDRSDYFLKEFDSKTWKPIVVSEFFPLIDSQSAAYKGIYWGYPWDIQSLQLKQPGSEVQIQATYDHDIESQLEEPSVASKVKGPAILFKGVPTQGEATGKYEKYRTKLKFVPLNSLLKPPSAKPEKKK